MESLASIRQSHQALRVHTNIAEKVIAVTRDPAFRKRLEAEQSMSSFPTASLQTQTPPTS